VSCSASDRVAPVQIAAAIVIVVPPVVKPGEGFHRRKDRFEFLEPDPLLLLFLLLGNVVFQFDGSVPAAAESSAAVVPAGSSAAPAAIEAATAIETAAAIETTAAAQSPAFAETVGQTPKTKTSPIEGIESGSTGAAAAASFGGAFGCVEIGTALAIGRVVSSRPGVGP